MWISQDGIFYFFHILELFPFFVFYYFLYFMPASQHIMKMNTLNWRLGLVEYIMYNDIDIAKLWRHIWRHEFKKIHQWFLSDILSAN